MFSLEFSETNHFMRLPGFSTLLLELPPLLELPSRWGGRRRASTSLAGASTSPAGASTSPLPVFGEHFVDEWWSQSCGGALAANGAAAHEGGPIAARALPA